MKTYLHYLSIYVLMLNCSNPVWACSPLNTPFLTSQTISGSNLVLNWTGNTWYTCNYYIEVEIACNSSLFTGAGPFYTTASVTSTGYMYPYPVQNINISSLCPGTTYNFRAREVFPPTSYSPWTSTFTFVTPGTFIAPSYSVTAFPMIICPPGTSQLTASVTGACGPGSPSYLWTPATGLSNPNIANPVASPSSTTTYTCTVNGGITGCYNLSSSVTVTVTPLPAAGMADVSEDTLCTGELAVLTLTGYSGSIQWQSSAGGGGPWVNIPGANASTYITPPLYVSTCYRASVSSCSSVNSNVVCITVNTTPTVIVNSPNICLGQTASLTASGGASYLWSTGSGGSYISVSPTTTSSYSVTGWSGGCSATALSTVTVTAYPVITVNSTIICKGENATLTASGASAYLWDNGLSDNPLIISPSAATTYTVTGTNLNCSGTATAIVNLYPEVIAGFTSPSSVSILDPLLYFTNTSQNAVSWDWDFGEPESNDNHADSENPAHTYSNSGIFCVTLSVTSPEQCPDSEIHCVEVEPLFIFYIPNAFSPDGNGINDEFFAKAEGVTEYQMSIYNRWGNLVFFGDDINSHWDGKVNEGSETDKEDVYVYVVKLKDYRQKKHQFTGTVTLIK